MLSCTYNEVDTPRRGKIVVKKDCNNPSCPTSSAHKG